MTALSREKERLIRRLGRRRMRVREALVLVEGVRSVQEAVEGAAEILFVVVSPRLEETERGASLLRFLEAGHPPVFDVDDRALAGLAATDHPQGVLMVCREPRLGLDGLTWVADGRLLVLDQVQDPGNVGTLVRSARAFDWTAVVALEGTADPWMPKAVRASAGAAFHLPVVAAGWEDLRRWLDERGVPLLVANASGADAESLELRRPWALVVGNEGAGPRAALREAADAVLSVAMPGGGDSLNAAVAASTIMYVLTRKERSG